MKQQKQESKRKALIVSGGICICNVDDYPAWVEHNIATITHLFMAFIFSEIRQGHDVPPPESLEKFCKTLHAECLAVIAEEGVGATRH